MLAALCIVQAVVRHAPRIDDYQRLLLLQGLSVAFDNSSTESGSA